MNEFYWIQEGLKYKQQGTSVHLQLSYQGVMIN